MAGASINWNNNQPGANDNAGQGDDVIRSIQSNIQGGLDAEHIWGATAGLHGAHRAGSARVAVAASISAISSADTTGRLAFQETTNRLWYTGTGPYPIGGTNVPFMLPLTGGSAASYYWAVDFGLATPAASSSSVGVTFTSGYSGVPYVFAFGKGSSPGPAQITYLATASRVSFYFWSGGTASAADIWPTGSTFGLAYLSIGTRVLE